ncbi:MAG: iron uptake porin [Cyanobacteria bacterium J06621_8]
MMLNIMSIVLVWGMEAKATPQITTDNLNEHGKTNMRSLSRQSSLSKNHQGLTSRDNYLVAQMNSVQQLQEINSTDWSYQAFQDLRERYDCVAAVLEPRTPVDMGIFSKQPETPISRAEFALRLNTCLNQLENRLAQAQNIPHQDLELILRLMQEFQSDLATLKGGSDGAEARLQDLEATQFSPTSKLQGEAIFALGSPLSGGDDASSVLGNRLRLELTTSFQGEDLLFTRLTSSRFPGFSEALGTFEGDLSFAENTDGDIQLDTLYYSFRVGDRLEFILGAAGLEGDDIAPTISFLDGDGGSRAISTFGTRNPIYNPPGEAGVGVSYSPIEQIKLSTGYLASRAEDPSSDAGLFAGPYSVLGQIILNPIENLSFAATYVHSFNQSDTETGTNLANLQNFSAGLFGSELPTVNSSYGLELSWSINSRLVIGGRGGLSKVSNLDTLQQPIDRGTQDIWDWAASIALPDLGKEGSVAGIVVGSEPTETNSSITNIPEDGDRSLHVEAFYQYQINDNISVTPGVVWITEPDSNVEDSPDLLIGIVRTTFSF